MSIKDEIKNSFREGSTLTKLIYINLGVFVVVGLVVMIMSLFNLDTSWTQYLMLPASFGQFLQMPWTCITYMFLHFNFIHIIFNILILYWLGKIFLHFFSQKDLVGTYVLGGLGGAAFYLLAYAFLPYFSSKMAVPLLGASASIMAIIVAVAVANPNYPVRLLFFGEVKLKWIALITILVSMLSMTSMSAGGHISLENAGGEISHLGGALAGYLYAVNYKKGKNIVAWVSWILDHLINLFKRKSKLKVSYQRRPTTDQEYNLKKKQDNDHIDRILEKIKKGGYDSLTKEEKQELFRASKK